MFTVVPTRLPPSQDSPLTIFLECDMGSRAIPVGMPCVPALESGSENASKISLSRQSPVSRENAAHVYTGAPTDA